MPRRVYAALLSVVFLLAGPGVSGQYRPGVPMRIVLLVDSSSAVAPMVSHFRMGLDTFLEGLPGDPEIMIVTTGSQLRVRVPPTSDRTRLRSAASGFTADGGGNVLLDALLESDRRFLKSAPERRPIFVILTTDAANALGEPRLNAYNDFIEDFMGRGGRGHAIIVRGVRSGLNSQIAENLAQNTGGYCETILIANAIPTLMKTLTEYVAADQ
jgi:von Willebrand factor type A domain